MSTIGNFYKLTQKLIFYKETIAKIKAKKDNLRITSICPLCKDQNNLTSVRLNCCNAYYHIKCAQHIIEFSLTSKTAYFHLASCVNCNSNVTSDYINTKIVIRNNEILRMKETENVIEPTVKTVKIPHAVATIKTIELAHAVPIGKISSISDDVDKIIRILIVLSTILTSWLFFENYFGKLPNYFGKNLSVINVCIFAANFIGIIIYVLKSRKSDNK